MIGRKDVMPVNFLKKEKFTGSDTGMRYRMEMACRGEEPDAETVLAVTAWPEPYGFDATPDERKIRQEFPFSEEGIVSGVEWLNARHGEIAGDEKG